MSRRVMLQWNDMLMAGIATMVLFVLVVSLTAAVQRPKGAHVSATHAARDF